MKVEFSVDLLKAPLLGGYSQMTGGQETSGQEERQAEVVKEMEKHEEIVENSELVLFQEKECYVYMVHLW